MSFVLTILGSSSAIPTAQRFPAAHLLSVDERFFLIDCGEGTQIQLRRLHTRMSRINHIFISHLHGDHVFGLFGLLSSYNLMGRTADLHLYADSRLEEVLQIHSKFFDQQKCFNLIFHPLTGKKCLMLYEDQRISVSAFPLKHSTPCYGFLFQEKQHLRNIRKEAIQKFKIPFQAIPGIKKGEDFCLDTGEIVSNDDITIAPPPVRSYAYCTDTRYDPSIVKYIQNVDLLYHETTFMKKDHRLAKQTLHSTTEQAAKLALEAGVKHLIAGHFSVRYKNIDPLMEEITGIFPNATPATDGDMYRLQPGRNVERLPYNGNPSISSKVEK